MIYEHQINKMKTKNLIYNFIETIMIQQYYQALQIKAAIHFYQKIK